VRPAVALVVAKAPVPGEAKTRLGRVVGPELAADLAAAAWLDTIEACVSAFGVDRCHLALTGDLARAARTDELAAAIAGWTVHEQRGDDFAERLRHAHEDAAAAAGAPVVQVGMDTPQVEPRHLREVEALLAGADDAVLGPAEDGGWWLLGVGGPHLLEHLSDVPMSTADTGRLTQVALEKAGARVVPTVSLRDVDEPDDAEAVAALAPQTRFARAWRAR
jgi:glycosyltransferase A (GT-A) superfamily protein (DUF2064 family)